MKIRFGRLLLFSFLLIAGLLIYFWRPVALGILEFGLKRAAARVGVTLSYDALNWSEGELSMQEGWITKGSMQFHLPKVSYRPLFLWKERKWGGALVVSQAHLLLGEEPIEPLLSCKGAPPFALDLLDLQVEVDEGNRLILRKEAGEVHLALDVHSLKAIGGVFRLCGSRAFEQIDGRGKGEARLHVHEDSGELHLQWQGTLHLPRGLELSGALDAEGVFDAEQIVASYEAKGMTLKGHQFTLAADRVEKEGGYYKIDRKSGKHSARIALKNGVYTQHNLGFCLTECTGDFLFEEKRVVSSWCQSRYKEVLFEGALEIAIQEKGRAEVVLRKQALWKGFKEPFELRCALQTPTRCTLLCRGETVQCGFSKEGGATCFTLKGARFFAKGKREGERLFIEQLTMPEGEASADLLLGPESIECRELSLALPHLGRFGLSGSYDLKRHGLEASIHTFESILTKGCALPWKLKMSDLDAREGHLVMEDLEVAFRLLGKQLSLQRIEGRAFGLDLCLLGQERAQMHCLKGKIQLHEAMGFLGPGLQWKGELHCPKGRWNELKIQGELVGRECLLGDLRVEEIRAELTYEKGRCVLRNLFLKDRAGLCTAETAYLVYKEGGWEIDLPKCVVTDLRLGRLRSEPLKQEKGRSYPALRVTSCVVEGLKGRFGDKESFEGRGHLIFSNAVNRGFVSHLLRIPKEITGRVGLDLSLLVPERGEIHYSIEGGKVYLHKLKNVFSEGKRSRFYLAKGGPSYIDFEGNLHLNVKMKQYNLLMKLAEFFTMTVRGTVEKPSYMFTNHFSGEERD